MYRTASPPEERPHVFVELRPLWRAWIVLVLSAAGAAASAVVAAHVSFGRTLSLTLHETPIVHPATKTTIDGNMTFIDPESVEYGTFAFTAHGPGGWTSRGTIGNAFRDAHADGCAIVLDSPIPTTNDGPAKLPLAFDLRARRREPPSEQRLRDPESTCAPETAEGARRAAERVRAHLSHRDGSVLEVHWGSPRRALAYSLLPLLVAAAAIGACHRFRTRMTIVS